MKQAIILLFVFAFITGYAKTRDSVIRNGEPVGEDSLMIWEKPGIRCEPRINDLLKQLAAQNKKSGSMSGFRLQLFFGSGEKAHAQAVKIKTEFLTSNPGVKTYLLFKSPDFIVRVGNFRTKSEALKMQKALLFQYPNAFIVADDIAFPELLNNSTIN